MDYLDTEEFSESAHLVANDEFVHDESSLSNNNNNNNVPCEQEPQKFGLKRQVNLLSSVSLLIGLIIGSGIFASPRSVAIYAGSSGAILLVWFGCGCISILAALVWCELGTMFPNASGSEYSYICAAFGPLIGFVYLFTSVVALQTSGLSMVALVCGDYVMAAAGSGNALHSKLIAAALICRCFYLFIYEPSLNCGQF